MKIPLAWRNLVHQKVRTGIALAAITFAIVLIFVQLGFYRLSLVSAIITYTMMDFDVMVVSNTYIDFNNTGRFPRTRLYQCLEYPDVVSATPLYKSMVSWRNPTTGLRNPILLLGVSPEADAFRLPQLRDNQWQLHRTLGVLMDQLTQPPYGPRYAGMTTEAGGQQVEVMALYRHGTGLNAGGAIVASELTYQLLTGNSSLDKVQFGLIKVRPGADLAMVTAELSRRLPPDVRVFPRAVIEARDQKRTVHDQPVGLMFSAGALMGFFVGAVILYQVLATDILKRLREYATMKALGYTTTALNTVVIQQAFLYALLGYLPALLIADGMYALLRYGTGLPVVMSWQLALFVFVLAGLMCGISAFVGIRKVQAADPADLF